jgi:DNA-directed RNA polymerase specialized sigma24 family protein
MATEPTSEPGARRRGRLVARRAGNPEVDLLGGLDKQHAEAEHLVNRDMVAAALGRLTQEHRDVLRECYFRGSSVAQAADALEIAPDMVKCRAYYALHELRLAIEELGGVQ